MYGQVGQQYLFLSPSGILNPIVGLFLSLMHFSWDDPDSDADPEELNWSDRRIANCQTVMRCW